MAMGWWAETYFSNFGLYKIFGLKLNQIYFVFQIQNDE